MFVWREPVIKTKISERKQTKHESKCIFRYECVCECECMPYARCEVKRKLPLFILFIKNVWSESDASTEHILFSSLPIHALEQVFIWRRVVLDHMQIVYTAVAAAAIFLNEISIFSAKQQQRWKRQAYWITETDTYIIICKTLQRERTTYV